MDSYCVAIKANVLPASRPENGFFGERIKSSKENVFGSRFWKNLGEKGRRDLRPGVAYSVLTRDINKEMAVSLITVILRKFCFGSQVM